MAAMDNYNTEQLTFTNVKGHCLHGAVYLPFGDLDRVEDFFDPAKFKDVKLKLTGASGVAPTKVLLQQLRA